MVKLGIIRDNDGIILEYSWMYPLVICYIAIETDH
jgi:hypothetical protein